MINADYVRSPRILVMGIGGIGGIVSASLIKAGYALTLITGNDEITDRINSEGITVVRGGDEVSFFCKAHTDFEDIPDSSAYDIAMLIMKANSVVQAAETVLPYLSSDGYVATFQNGIVEPEVMEAIGKKRVIPVTVGFGATMVAPGTYERTSPGGFHIGEWDGSTTRRLAELRTILSEAGPVETSDNMQGVLWSKLAINCTINTPGAVTGQPLGQLLASREARDFCLSIYQEVVDVARAKGIRLEKVASNPYLLYRPADAGLLTRFVKDIITRMMGIKYRRTRSSTLQSVERGRRSETEFLNGFVVEVAKEVGLDVPYNQTITDLMGEIDSGDLRPDPSNIEIMVEKALR